MQKVKHTTRMATHSLGQLIWIWLPKTICSQQKQHITASDWSWMMQLKLVSLSQLLLMLKAYWLPCKYMCSGCQVCCDCNSNRGAVSLRCHEQYNCCACRHLATPLDLNFLSVGTTFCTRVNSQAVRLCYITPLVGYPTLTMRVYRPSLTCIVATVLYICALPQNWFLGSTWLMLRCWWWRKRLKRTSGMREMLR